MKTDPRLSACALIRQPRMAVMPVTDIKFQIIADELLMLPRTGASIIKQEGRV